MADELIDIVDERGTVLRQTLKSQAHASGDLHTCVIGEIRDLSGKWVLIKQASDRQDAGQYVSPVGGHVSAGETDEEAFLREAFEEAGLVDFEYESVGSFTYDRFVIGRQENHSMVVYKITVDPARIILGEESVSWRAFTEAELRSALADRPAEFGDAFRELLKHFYPHMLAEQV